MTEWWRRLFLLDNLTWNHRNVYEMQLLINMHLVFIIESITIRPFKN